MASPFNSVAELITRTAFSQGESGTEQSVIDATFTFSQFQSALQDARDFISKRTKAKAVADMTDERVSELTQAEIYLAIAILFEMFGERIPLKSPDANLSSVGTRLQGADTPSPPEKGRHWVEFMATRYRSRGMTLLLGQPFEIKLGANTSTDRFPCLLPRRFSMPELISCCD